MTHVPDRKVLLDRYDVGEVIGTGGTGEVRAARDLTLERPVAIKFLRAHMGSSPEVRARFDSEAKAAARLSHPNIVAVFDFGDDETIPFIVMERISGGTLADKVAQGPLGESEVRRLGLEMLSALEASHDEGILHRDLKPGNVLLTDQDRVKVADFGIAKLDESVDTTNAGTTLGTPAYLAPERVAGEPATVASDIYSVGVVLYELLTGRKPFEADALLALARMIQEDFPEPVASLRPDVDPYLAAIVEKAMAKDPRRRFRSAARMRQALQDWIPQSESDVTASLFTSPATKGLVIRNRGRSRAGRYLVGVIIGVLAVAWPVYLLLSIEGAAPGHAETASPEAPPEPQSDPLNPDLEAALVRLEDLAGGLAAGDELEGGLMELRAAARARDRLAVSDELERLRGRVQLLGSQGELPPGEVDGLMAALFGVELELGKVGPP